MRTPSAHRPWCQRDLCTPIAHYGRRVEISSRDGFAPVTVQIRQGACHDGQPVIVLASVEGEVVMPAGQARAVDHVLRHATRRVGGEY